MSQVLQYRFELFGPRKGQTITINGHIFIQGVCQENVRTEAGASLIKVLGNYGAYAYGTPEFDAAKKAETDATAPQDEEVEKEKEVTAKEPPHGTDEVHTDAISGEPEQVPSGAGSPGAGPASLPSDDLSGTDEIAADEAGNDTSGNGHEDSGVTKFEELADIPKPQEPDSVGNDEIKTALLKLDPENDDHWSKRGPTAGKPSLGAVEAALGRAGVTRSDTEAALPGWNRETALAAQTPEPSAEDIAF